MGVRSGAGAEGRGAAPHARQRRHRPCRLAARGAAAGGAWLGTVGRRVDARPVSRRLARLSRASQAPGGAGPLRAACMSRPAKRPRPAGSARPAPTCGRRRPRRDRGGRPDLAARQARLVGLRRAVGPGRGGDPGPPLHRPALTPGLTSAPRTRRVCRGAARRPGLDSAEMCRSATAIRRERT